MEILNIKKHCAQLFLKKLIVLQNLQGLWSLNILSLLGRSLKMQILEMMLSTNLMSWKVFMKNGKILWIDYLFLSKTVFYYMEFHLY